MLTPTGGTDHRLNLLLVDDREANLQSLSQLLARDDVRIFTALSGNEALALMLEHDFALVLLDVQMPGMDGFEVAMLMRSHERTRHVPVIFVTAISRDRQHVFSGYDAGAVDYLFKPLDPHVIRAKVAVFLELKRSQQERDRLLESLRCANAQLEASAQAKSDSLAAASHELRTPLTAMKEFCSLVHDEVVGPVNAEQKHCLEAALRNCRRLGGIVERLVDLSTLESGSLRLRRGRLDLGGALREAASRLSPRCEAAGQRIELALPPDDAPAWALADPELVAGILAHLLENAHRFSPPGGAIRLRVRTVGDRLALEVGDQGPGIEPRHRERIIRKYAQVGRRDGPGEQGLGLGLAIVTRLLELHDSRLDLVSTPGRGSIFGFSLPAYTEAGHLSAFCRDSLRLAPRRWEPRCLVLVAARDGGPVPAWPGREAVDEAGDRNVPTAELTLEGRPLLAALVRESDPGPAAWLAGLQAASGRPDLIDELVWTMTEVDRDGVPGPIAAAKTWNSLVPGSVPAGEGAWR
jgi:signal transduction histidine kinase